VAEHLTFDGYLLWQTNDVTPNFRLRSEKDVNGRVNIIEELGDRTSNLYRATKAENGIYTVTMGLVAGWGYTLTELKAAWEAWHSQVGGERVVERETDSGITQYLDAVPETPQWGEEGHDWAEVTQAYTAARPFWYGAEQSVSGNFNGATPVSLAFDNVGDVPCWIRIAIEDAVEDPKVAYSDEWEIEFDLELVAGDELAVNCRTPATAWYTPAATGVAGRAYGYRTNETSFRLAKLPVGSGNLTLTATSGTGACTVYWTPLYEALQ